VDYAGDIASAKSTNGYLFMLAGGPIMWKSKLQFIIAQCYERERDQGTLGSVAGCRHSRTPGRTCGFLIGSGRMVTRMAY
jgi:hypothetical protein